jgi:hypothetical protein
MSMGSSVARGPESTVPVNRRGLSGRGERALSAGGTIVLCLLAIGWGWSFAVARRSSSESGAGDLNNAARTISSALTSGQAPTAAYLTDAALTAATERILGGARGASGKLEAAIEPSAAPLDGDTLPNGTRLEYSNDGKVAPRPTAAGIWNVLLNIGNALRPISNFNVIAMLPFSAKKNGRVGLYYVGNWPSEAGAVGPAKAPKNAYATPQGFIEVTPQNAGTPVSEHFVLRDFLTHDQPNVWPKYMVLKQELVDKLELVLTDLSERGYDVHGVKIMSGFRTPQYNYTGGNTTGRANLSRHMYGDAADIYIDDDGDGQMDDLDHDGKISVADSRVIEAAVDRVEAAHPELVGGAGVYTAAPGHGPFIHIDVRGYRARWSGTSGG